MIFCLRILLKASFILGLILSSSCSPYHSGPKETFNGEFKPKPIPLAPNFESIKQNILSPKCIVCHRVGGKAEKIPLLTIDNIVNSPRRLIIRGYPDDSKLIWEIEDGKMPPPESGIRPVTSIELSAIKEWIAKGASD